MRSPEMSGLVITPVEQSQKLRQFKGNQELNDELQMKANELEKLFAAHKLRISGDQSVIAHRSKVADMQVEQMPSAIYGKSAELTPVYLPEKNPLPEPFLSTSNKEEFDQPSLTKMVDSHIYGKPVKHSITELGLSEDTRGKYYDRYMQKRDAKLREEWGSKRAQKEAKMKAMQDSLERCRAEMKAIFAGSSDRQVLDLHGHQRAVLLRSFTVCSTTKHTEQHLIESFKSEEDEDLSEFPEQSQYEQDASLSYMSVGDGSSRSALSKKLLHSKSLSSSTPQTSVAPVPRSSIKRSNSSTGKRQTQPDNSLAQSVPNFSDLRKENTKPSSGISKTTNRSQLSSYARSKSTGKELALPKEYKTQRSLKSNGVLTPLRFSKELTNQSIYGNISKNGGSKPFLRKGNGIGPGAGAGIVKMKSSMASDNLKNEQSHDMTNLAEDSVDLVKAEKEEGDFGAVTGDKIRKVIDFPADSNNEKRTLSEESENSVEPQSDNGDSQLHPNLVAEVATATTITFHSSVEPLQDSPGESPASWNSHMHHLFCYTSEVLDVNASVDSSVGSPALCNSHSLTQVESDASQMRKKWSNAQKPILLPNAAHHPSHKGVTKGFKRLLKFGRKSQGTESMVDWVSATTSEGDDDTEDGRDPANQSSEDSRKSRMGFSQGYSSYDGLNDGELFNEQVQALCSSIPASQEKFKPKDVHLSGSSLKAPRSFFSFSSFRSKGSESKPRC
ncbi:PREDICTED: uncharacterized protein LOC104609395 [Nelumbo nucifera]|uniref:Uncharacterized protein LOC104609395 n=2 Tax=Nelumbo nucifera TaxID=4432 RepID=A0A1U8Q956_NELNU|nr:PREDICTED: uncharacterized protein LOC104609395 [Nelumbo nucifera]XP_019055310.1 PREDICTED: uncharacterized protein LOC104609395 [Nelumbo nucifera]DAD49125.1 TPA_asm: hypothetical protein HUJ06_019062 [Nelumbo nucifera]